MYNVVSKTLTLRGLLVVLLTISLVFLARAYQASSSSVLTQDVRQSLLASAQNGDPALLSSDLVLTHFSHVCELVKSDGGIIYVADRRAVLPGMSAPRGLNYITFFTEDFTYLGKVRYTSARPLWCDNNKLYLFGNLDGGDIPGEGNVIDLSGGFHDLQLYSEEAYGSSD